MKAFLFGGDSNGKILDIEDHAEIIKIQKEKHVANSFSSFSEHGSIVFEFDEYKKYNEKFTKKLSNSSVVIEMEDLGVSIHESFTHQEKESLSKIILMVIGARWNPVKGYSNDH